MARPISKRQFDQSEDEVDDLAVAAGFAVATALTEPSPTLPFEDDNEIDIDKDQTEEDVQHSIDDDEESDDESDVDLQRELAEMLDEEEEIGVPVDRPKTAHEIDAYATQVNQLESTLHMNISIRQDEQLKLLHPSDLKVAGRVQHHMVQERTMVIRSLPNLLLEEGNILACKNDAANEIILLGKIFEVFGPVSEPLYSVRFPEHQPAEEENIVVEDYWGRNGKYTNMISQDPNRAVFFVEKEAKLINTSEVYRLQGRGCDASNMHDEEILNPSEMYYSDDEEERQAKKGAKSRSTRAVAIVASNSGVAPLRVSGFHATNQTRATISHELQVEPSVQQELEGDTEYFD